MLSGYPSFLGVSGGRRFLWVIVVTEIVVTTDVRIVSWGKRPTRGAGPRYQEVFYPDSCLSTNSVEDLFMTMTQQIYLDSGHPFSSPLYHSYFFDGLGTLLLLIQVLLGVELGN